jgi:hypothetical protein
MLDTGSEFPASLGNVARRELAAHGITRFAQLDRMSAKDLLAIHGVGPKALRILREELASRGVGAARGLRRGIRRDQPAPSSSVATSATCAAGPSRR